MAKKTPWYKTLLSFLGSLILFLLIGIGLLYIVFNKIHTFEINKENIGITNTNTDIESTEDTESNIVSDKLADKKIKNIALFGIDSTDDIGRSDSIMIATVDSIHNKLKITSIMRDSYVYIDNHGYDKINHAYAFGGPELSLKTLNQTFGLNIDSFVSVDFKSLPIIIDTLGGIELTITENELSFVNDYIRDINRRDGTTSPQLTYAGNQLVDGVQALAYSRVRYTSGGDSERTQRHRTILNKILDKAVNITPLQYPALVNKLLPYVQTNLSVTDILTLATKVVSLDSSTIEQERFPKDEFSQDETISGVYYLTFDRENTKQQIIDYIFNDSR